MKNFILIAIGVAVLLIGSIYWSKSMQGSRSDIISKEGLHWHPELEIYVNGEKHEIPANIGIGGRYSAQPMGMSAIHTHEDLPIIHLEFSGLVRESDIRLGKFFEVWGKSFREFGPNVSMTVTGVENTEFENYIMQDGDKIVLRYSN